MAIVSKSAAMFPTLAVLALGAGPERIDTATAQGDELVGTWRLVAYEHDGHKAPPAFLRDVCVPFATKHYVVTPNLEFDKKSNGFHRGWLRGQKYWYTLIPNPNLSQINIKSDSCETDEPDQEGIYLLDGNTLTICVADYDKAWQRPTSFRTEAGSHRILFVLKRVRP